MPLKRRGRSQWSTPAMSSASLSQSGTHWFLDRPVVGPLRLGDLVVRVAPGIRRRIQLLQLFDGESRAGAGCGSFHRATRGTRRRRHSSGWGRCPADRGAGDLSRGLRRRGHTGVTRTLLVRNTTLPPGRSNRAASPIHPSASHHRLAPYSLTTRSQELSGSGTAVRRRRRAETSVRTPVGSGAPTRPEQGSRRRRPAGHRGARARPRSTPCRSPTRRRPTRPHRRAPHRGLRDVEDPHVISSVVHFVSACPSVYWALTWVHNSRLIAAAVRRSVTVGWGEQFAEDGFEQDLDQRRR